MKRTLLLLALALPVAAQLQLQPMPPSITTSGEATINVVPDQIEIVAGVEKQNGLLSIAKRSCDVATAAILAAARAHGVNERDLQTDFMMIEPSYDSQRTVTYWARKSVSIVTRDVRGFEALMTALVAAGANHVSSVTFKTTQLRRFRDEARKLATKAALEKAQLLAQSLGRRVGKARQISEGWNNGGASASSWWGSWSRYNTTQNASVNASGPEVSTSPDGSLALGQIPVSASVSVTFDLE